MDKNDRHLELSGKFLEMGHALMKEGNENEDFTVSHIGTCMMFLGGLVLDEDDVKLFGEICSMFSAKKILDSMENNNHDYAQFLKEKSSKESYEDFIKRINKLRGDNGHTPIGD